MNYKWIRVNKQNPCVVCGRKDWDTYCPELNLACCMRVQSNRPCKNGGWLHPIGDTHLTKILRQPEPPRPTINFTALWNEWAVFTDYDAIQVLGLQLGVSPLALRCLGAVWSGENWAFPMRDEWGNICGIQLRYKDGFKQTMRGSHVGYFLPECSTNRTAFVCEGCSDTASALTLGLYAVGRYNCAQSGIRLGQYLRRKGVRDVVIISDNDAPGISGAEKLAGELGMHCCIYTPPAKDLRDLLRLGGTRQLIESTISSLMWRNA